MTLTEIVSGVHAATSSARVLLDTLIRYLFTVYAYCISYVLVRMIVLAVASEIDETICSMRYFDVRPGRTEVADCMAAGLRVFLECLLLLPDFGYGCIVPYANQVSEVIYDSAKWSFLSLAGCIASVIGFH
jgi:hypothetical protein